MIELNWRSEDNLAAFNCNYWCIIFPLISNFRVLFNRRRAFSFLQIYWQNYTKFNKNYLQNWKYLELYFVVSEIALELFYYIIL